MNETLDQGAEAAPGAARATGAGATGEGAPPEATGRPARPVLSIRWIVTGVAVALTAAAVVSVSAVAERNARRSLTDELEARLILGARNLAITSAPAMLGDFPELTLHPLVKEMMAKQPELAFAVVVDPRGQIQGHADAHRLGTPYEPPPGLAPQPSGVPLAPGESIRADGALLVATAPVTHPDGRVMGSVLVGLPRAYLDRLVGAARRQQALLLAAFLVAGVIVSFLLVSQLLKPIGALRAGIDRIARGDLETPVAIRDRTELGLLAGAMNRMAGELRRAQREMVERERLSHELQLAHDLQRSLLPTGTLVAGGYVIEGTQRAAAEVGGDYYDYFTLPDGRIGLAIADVAGKGLGGCLVMSMLSALLRAYRTTHLSPTEMLATLDERLSETLKPGSFVTMFYAVLDPATGRLTWASAGHNPLLVYRAADAAVETVAGRGIPLGAVRGAIRRTLRDAVVTLEPGDVLVQYTDGLNEAFDPAGRQQLGVARMESAIAAAARGGATAVIASLHDTLRAWTGDGAPDDDETVLVVTRPLTVASAPSAVSDPVADAVVDAPGLLAEAHERGACLTFVAHLEVLTAIGPWLRACGPAEGMAPADHERLELAIYEACANVVEHGCHDDPSQEIELWWIPGPEDPPAHDPPPPALDPALARLAAGRFLIRDQGAPFRPERWRETDFADPAARRRGRGLGLDIIHRTARQVVFHPGTPCGNLTLLTFGPFRERPEPGEVRHVG